MSKSLAQHATAGYATPKMKKSRRDGGDVWLAILSHHESLCANRRKTSFNPPAIPARQDERENQFCVQPMIQQISQPAAQQNRAHKSKRQLHSQRRLRRYFFTFAISGDFGSLLF